MHYLTEDTCFRYDLIDPVTKAPLPLADGVVGEALHTGLEYEAAPAFRYATGDILKINVGFCPGCGVFGTRMQVVGRVDDMLAIKGVKVFPTAIQNVVLQFRPRVSGEMRVRLDAPPPRVEPPLRLAVEAALDLPDDAGPRHRKSHPRAARVSTGGQHSAAWEPAALRAEDQAHRNRR